MCENEIQKTAAKASVSSRAQERTNASSKGIFISFEGGEGAGKSTHIAFLSQCLHALGYEVLCVREPGGTTIGEALRNIVLNPENDVMDARAELFIYEAARAQIVAQVIKPALERGAVVLCDRFYDSTVAYQAYGRGLSIEFINTANAFACQGLTPDRTILMVSTTAKEGLMRATEQGADRIERAGLDFHARVNAAFAEIAREQPERIRVVSFAESKAQTAKRVYEQVKDLIPTLEQAAADNPSYFDNIENVKDGKYLSPHDEKNADEADGIADNGVANDEVSAPTLCGNDVHLCVEGACL